MRQFVQKHNQRSHLRHGPGSSRAGLQGDQTVHPVLLLQRLIGNQAVRRLLSAPPRQVRGALRAVAHPATVARAGRDAPMPLHPLTEEERAVDLQSARLRDDARLQEAYDNKKPLLVGHSGPAVEKLQQAFIDLGFGMPRSTKRQGKPDGIFGQETSRVVKGFQWRQGIVKDGVVGRQTLGELDGLLSGQSPPGTRPAGPEVPGTPLFLREAERKPKEYGKCGGFTWSVDWDTNARNGYLIQEVTKEYTATGCPIPPPVGLFTPHYFEAWRVQEDGGIHGTSGADDDWINPCADASKPLEGFPATKGRWRTTGRVFFVSQLDPKAGFKVAGVADAGSLWSTTTPPENLGPVLLVRSEGAEWDCCGGETSQACSTEGGKAAAGPWGERV